MNVHPFGKVDCSMLLILGLKENSNRQHHQYIARAKEAITEKFYTDDYLNSFNTQSEAMEIP